MYAGSAAVYGAKHQTRCLAAVLGDQERHRFLTGSTSLREPNQVGCVVSLLVVERPTDAPNSIARIILSSPSLLHKPHSSCSLSTRRRATPSARPVPTRTRAKSGTSAQARVTPAWPLPATPPTRGRAATSAPSGRCPCPPPPRPARHPPPPPPPRPRPRQRVAPRAMQLLRQRRRWGGTGWSPWRRSPSPRGACGGGWV